MVSADVSRPVVWGAPKPSVAVPPRVGGAQIVRVKASGVNIGWVL